MLNQSELKANQLLDLLEDADLNTINGLRTIEFQYQLHKNDIANDRIGLSSNVGGMTRDCNHFYLFVDDYNIYFSNSSIYIRFEKEINNDNEMYTLEEIEHFIEDYFQLSTTRNYHFSVDLYKRIYKYMQYFNKWVTT